MAKIKWRGGALLAPAPPALVTCGDMEKSNALAVAWTGIINTVPPKTYISVRPGRYSYSMIKESGEFVINLTSADMIKALDGCGMLTGAKVDKFAKFGLEKQEASEVKCPLVAQSPLSLECRVTDVIELGSHHMFLANVVAVDVEEALIDQHGKLRLDKANLAAFAHGEYFALGKKIGDFGFSVRKKKKPLQKGQVKKS